MSTVTIRTRLTRCREWRSLQNICPKHHRDREFWYRSNVVSIPNKLYPYIWPYVRSTEKTHRKRSRNTDLTDRRYTRPQMLISSPSVSEKNWQIPLRVISTNLLRWYAKNDFYLGHHTNDARRRTVRDGVWENWQLCEACARWFVGRERTTRVSDDHKLKKTTSQNRSFEAGHGISNKKEYTNTHVNNIKRTLINRCDRDTLHMNRVRVK